MLMIVDFKVKGDFSSTLDWLNTKRNIEARSALRQIGDHIIERLQAETPVDTGELRDSWYYKIDKIRGNYVLSVYNDAHKDEVDGLVYMLEYGHGTGTGGWVPPTHFVSRALQDFDSYVDFIIGGLINE